MVCTYLGGKIDKNILRNYIFLFFSRSHGTLKKWNFTKSLVLPTRSVFLSAIWPHHSLHLASSLAENQLSWVLVYRRWRIEGDSVMQLDWRAIAPTNTVLGHHLHPHTESQNMGEGVSDPWTVNLPAGEYVTSLCIFCWCYWTHPPPLPPKSCYKKRGGRLGSKIWSGHDVSHAPAVSSQS